MSSWKMLSFLQAMPGDGAQTGTMLFYPVSRGNILEMLPVAQSLRDRGWKPLFVLDPQRTAHSSVILDAGIAIVRPDGGALRLPIAPKDPTPDTVPHTTKPGTKERVFSRLPVFVQSLVLFRAERRRARKLLSRHPDTRLVIVTGDRNIGYETALIAEANRKDIPSLIVPFAMSFPEASAEPRLRRGSFQKKYGVTGLYRRLLRFFFPSWVRVHKGEPMFFQPPSMELAAWMLGMMPRKPWVIGGGAAARMAVESEAMRSLLEQQGMDPAKMVVTGKPSLDEVAEELKAVSPAEMRRRFGIADSDRIILCSVPQLAEHDVLPWERHREEMTFLFQTLAATGARVLLSLHPKSDRAWYQPLADAAGATILTERIYQLLPLCDIFVATYSSTMAPAIAMAKPAIVIDFFGLEYPVYDHAPLKVLRDREQFLPLLKRLLEDKAFYDAAVAKEKASGDSWALLDGRNTERIVALIKTLCR